MNLVDICSGIGGFSLAAEYMGWKTIAFCEQDKFCQKVLRKNFGNEAPIFSDLYRLNYASIKSFYRNQRGRSAPRIDIVTAGLPCQPFSQAGKRRGTSDERHLFPAFMEFLKDAAPKTVVIENVRGLLTIEDGRVFADVISSLESEGYEVTTFCIPASAAEACHRRDRLWIIARDTLGVRCQRSKSEQNSPDSKRRKRRGDSTSGANKVATNPSGEQISGTSKGEAWRDSERSTEWIASEDSASGANTPGERLQGNVQELETTRHLGFSSGTRSDFTNWFEAAIELCTLDDGVSERLDSTQQRWLKEAVRKFGRREMERAFGIDLGEFTSRVYRTSGLKAAGNSIYVPIAYEIFRAIEEADNDEIT